MFAAPSWPRGRRGTVRGASPRTPERVVLAPSIQRCAGSFCPLFLASSVDCCVSRSSLTGWKVACCSIRANHIPSYTIWPFGEAESEWLFGMCQWVSDARCCLSWGVVSLASGVAWDGKVGACSVGWWALAVRLLRLGEPCGASCAGRAVRGGVGGRMGAWCLCGAVCWVMMGSMPFFRGLGVGAGCAVGLFAVIVVVRHALLPS